MSDRDKNEEKNKRIGWLTSVGVQLVLLVLFYFIIAWKAPFPPIPEYGIELGFTTSAGASASVPSIPTETPEEIIEEQEQVEEATDAEEVIESEPEVQQVAEVATQEVPDVPLVEQTTVPEPVEEAEQETVDQRAVLKPSKTEGEQPVENPSEGEKENTEIDERAIYGNNGTNTGSNEGASLALSGWIWDFKPKPNDTSQETGKIIYKIVVDADGYLVKIETVTSTVSPSVERKYREAVQKLTFSKTSDYKAATLSTGEITFIIKSR